MKINEIPSYIRSLDINEIKERTVYNKEGVYEGLIFKKEFFITKNPAEIEITVNEGLEYHTEIYTALDKSYKKYANIFNYIKDIKLNKGGV